jgi:hypothetical protein
MRLIACAAVLAGLAVPALADDTFDLVVKHGKGIRQPFFSYVDGCGSSGAMRLDLAEAPKHGKVTFRYEDVKKEGKPCGGHIFRANVFYFQPDAGYKGKDQLILKMGHFTNTDQMNMVWNQITLNMTME